MDVADDSRNERPRWSLGALLAANCIACMWAAPSIAQEGADGGWHYLVEPYVMLPNMKGSVGIGNLPDAAVDEDPGDIFSNLQMGAMLYAEAHNASWALSSDLLYMKLGDDVPAGQVLASGDVDVSQIGWELAVLRRVSSWLELGIALTYNEIESDLDLVFNPVVGMAPVIQAGTSENWIDPTLVARATHDFNDRWFLRGRGNIGGFGIGSDLVWQVQVDVGYRFSSRSYLTAGYRVIDVDYEHGSGADRFKYDMSTFGPQLRFGFRF